MTTDGTTPGSGGLLSRLRRGMAPRAAVAPRARAAVRAIRDTAAEAQRSTIPQMAAALSYRTIFGLIPMIVVALVAVKQFFATPEDMARVLGDTMRYAGLSDISVHDPGPLMGPPLPPELQGGAPEGAPGGAEGSAQASAPAEGAGPASPDSAARLDRWITDLVQRVGQIRWGTIGGIGIALLIYAALAMLVELERAFNQIYRVPVGRSWPRRITQYWTVLTLGTLFLVATFYVGEQFKTWAVQVAQTRGFTVGGGGMTVALIGYVVTVAISTLLFLLAYTTVPNTRVQLYAALAGALVAALLWEAGKWGFTQYVRFSASASYARLYGSIALLPLFLIWVYFTWVITLFGLQVAYQLQHVQRRTVAVPTEALEPVIVEPSAILSVAGLLAERFERGEPASAKEVADRLSIHEPIAGRMLEQMAAEGLAHQVFRGSDEKAYALARPPHAIDAEALLVVGEQLSGGSPEARPDPLAEAMRRSRHEAVHGRNLASLIGSNGSPAAPAPTPGAPVELPSVPERRSDEV